MRASQLLLPTVKEPPSGAEAASHILLVRAGFVRQLAAGIYVYLPLGWRVMRKIERIIREELDAIGCQEMLMPVLQPAEIWQESGRWQAIGDEMFRLKDRRDADMALAMTHEEVVTWLAAREIRSYRQLPQFWYHFQTKERDEARPKSGILRTREFIMKDSYSLDVDDAGLQTSYQKHIGAYDRIFARCGLSSMMVEGDSGMMGGDVSHEYMAFSEAGEDEIVFCRACGYASNVETASAGPERGAPASARGVTAAGRAGAFDLTDDRELHTPGTRTIERVGEFLGLPAEAFVKALVVVVEGKGPALVLLRGDHEVTELKLEGAVGGDFRLATPDEVAQAQGVEPGFVGPVPTTLPVYADEALRRGHYVGGANKVDHHRSGIEVAALDGVTFVDVRRAHAGDACPRCEGTLEGARAIEVGNIFQLGTKYSEPMSATFLDEAGEERPIVMGCYGIGLARIAAAAVEQHHDADGIVWPASIAPYDVHLVLVRTGDETQAAVAEQVYADLEAGGLDTLFDDRELSPGVKFKDADLIGCPLQVVVGKRAGEGIVEVKTRATGERVEVAVGDLAPLARGILSR
jgi:prolyl-tRNA synthetase